MRVREKNMIDVRQLSQAQISRTRARINQYVVVNAQARRAQMPPADAAATSQDFDLHYVIVASCASVCVKRGNTLTVAIQIW